MFYLTKSGSLSVFGTTAYIGLPVKCEYLCEDQYINIHCLVDDRMLEDRLCIDDLTDVLDRDLAETALYRYEKLLSFCSL